MEKDENAIESKKSLDVPRPPEPGKFSTALENTDSTNTTSANSSRPITPKTPLTPISPISSRHDKVPAKLHIAPTELLKYESGLIIFQLMEAELPRSNTRVEVFVDDMAFPSYVSSTAKHKSYKFDRVLVAVTILELERGWVVLYGQVRMETIGDGEDLERYLPGIAAGYQV